MSKYYRNEWQDSEKNTTGLPRPFAFTFAQKPKNTQDFYLHPKVPIPWQSIPDFHNGGKLKLNKENEVLALRKKLCAYCGIKFTKHEIVIRWITGFSKRRSEDRVLSDNYPFHIKCMEEGRIFCPRMRKTKDSEYETGEFHMLEYNAIAQKEGKDV